MVISLKEEQRQGSFCSESRRDQKQFIGGFPLAAACPEQPPPGLLDTPRQLPAAGGSIQHPPCTTQAAHLPQMSPFAHVFFPPQNVLFFFFFLMDYPECKRDLCWVSGVSSSFNKLCCLDVRKTKNQFALCSIPIPSFSSRAVRNTD